MTDERIYTDIPEEIREKLPHSTTITNILDKSEGLMYWALELGFHYIVDIALKPVRTAIERKESEMAFDLLKEFFNYDLDYHYKKAKAYPRQKSKEAKDIGTYVHEAAEAVFRALMEESPIDIPVDDEIEKPVKALLKWIADNDVQPVLIEKQVYSYLPGFDSWGWKGRLDVVAYVRGILNTIDLKAAKDVYRDAPLQVASYDYAYDDMVEKGLLDTPGPTDGTIILRLDKETGYPDPREYTKEQTLDHFRCFGFLCCYWHSDQMRKEKSKKIPKKKKDPPY